MPFYPACIHACIYRDTYLSVCLSVCAWFTICHVGYTECTEYTIQDTGKRNMVWSVGTERCTECTKYIRSKLVPEPSHYQSIKRKRKNPMKSKASRRTNRPGRNRILIPPFFSFQTHSGATISIITQPTHYINHPTIRAKNWTRRNKNAPRIPLLIGPETFSKEEVVGTN